MNSYSTTADAFIAIILQITLFITLSLQYMSKNVTHRANNQKQVHRILDVVANLKPK
jgi:hypothetical protein